MTNGTNFLQPSLQQQISAAVNANSGGGPPSNMLAAMAGINDNPLEFNHTKKSQLLSGAGPMDLENANEITQIDCQQQRRQRLIKLKDDKDRRHSILDDATSNSSIDSLDKTIASINNNTAFGGLGGGGGGVGNQASDLMFNGIMGMPQSLMMMPASMMNMMDPMLGMQQFPMLSQLNPIQQASGQQQQQPQQIQIDGGNMQPVTVKEVITCKSCTLFPPNPNAPVPTTRERPPGCRTVFVGGLPENVTEDIIREVFERCGEITTLRLSKKNFCHIRFVFEPSVDSAIYLSGYRIRLGANTDSTNCGRLHVDYAQARDDQYEYECKQRQLQREHRHRERVERDRLRPLSPPPIVHYTDHEATAVAEKLKQDEHFGKAVQVLITWLERGDCSKKNAHTFYSMVQSSNSHVRRLQTEKSTYEEELQKAREHYRKQMYSMSIQCK